MDYSSRPGQKTGSGAPLSSQELAVARRERLKKLALETVDLKNDPYLSKNQLGSYECRLCLTLHSNESSYLSHTQGKKHQVNLAARALETEKSQAVVSEPAYKKVRKFTRIGRPSYRVTRVINGGLKGFHFELDFPKIKEDIRPVHRVMSAFEQRVETTDPEYQFVVIAAEPYETVAFKIPNLEVVFDESYGAFERWDATSHRFSLQLFLRDRVSKTLPVVNQRPIVSI